MLMLVCASLLQKRHVACSTFEMLGPKYRLRAGTRYRILQFGTESGTDDEVTLSTTSYLPSY